MKNLKDRCTPGKILGVLALFLCPAATFYLFDGYTHNAFVEMAVKTQVLNVILYLLIAVFLWGLFKRLHVALMVQSGFFMVLGLVNYYVLEFRSAPIMPWDIYSVGIAMSVADNFDYSLNGQAMVVLGGFAVLLIAEFFCKWKLEKKFVLAKSGKRSVGLSLRVVCVGLATIGIVGFTHLVQNDAFILEWRMYDKLFTPTVMCKRDGNAVAFLMELEYLQVEKPAGYDEEDVEEYLEMEAWAEVYEEDDVVSYPEEVFEETHPNIIVVMNEAFSDLSVLGEFETNVDYMPYLRSLQAGAENTITGNMHVSVLGGNTANTEFEFLTGASMAFLPQGSVAFQQYVNEEVPSVATYLKSIGYDTVAMHPYYASGWERDEVYPRLGFDRFLDITDFRGSDKIRNYYSDASCYEKIIDLYETKGEDPLFVFNVTMQNHSGYTDSFNNFKPGVEVEGSSSSALNMYLSLIKESDRALKGLIDYFSKADEDTIIVFFGDHQPTTYVSSPIRKLNGENVNDLTEEQQREYYEVPYVIWANFDIEEGTGDEISVNYLALELFEQCGFELSPYFEELASVREEYPIITSIQVTDAQGNVYEPKDVEGIKQVETVLNFYKQMQYYILFG